MSFAKQMPMPRGRAENLAVIFGDQLDHDAGLLKRLDPDNDVILMAEVDGEQEEGPSHKVRTAVFFAAMRHYALWLSERGFRVRYVRVDSRGNTQSLEGEIDRAIEAHKPQRLLVTHPGDWRVMETLDAIDAVDVEVLDDEHFYTTPSEFAEWADGRKSLVMEFFYREQRKKLGILMDGKQPTGGEWNYDKDNRESFKSEPGVRAPYSPEPDEITAEVISLVNSRYADAPGRLDESNWIWPVRRDKALRALRDFVEHRLADFGPFEDAMWTGEHTLFHSLLSVPLNLKLLNPRECVDAALEAFKAEKAPLNSVEGFVRQLIGWREYIRGVYWFEGADYRDRNFLGQDGDLPEFYWNGETDMKCMSECLAPVLDHAWSHHIPRLMVLSNFAMIAGVAPRAIGDWFYGMYADAVDWATTPNTIGMGSYADGIPGKREPVVGTKPYAASGKYISRMSNYCKHCSYDVKKRTGKDACPFNTFYWDFLIRHENRFSKNNRMAMIMKNVKRLKKDDRVEITTSAKSLREKFGVAPAKVSA